MSAAKGQPSHVPVNITRGIRLQRMADGLDQLRQVNARRVQCPHCPLTIAPEGMDRHVRINHSEDDDDD